MDKTGTPLSIMTQNLRCGYIREDRDGDANRIRYRQHRFKALVDRYAPDVIALQEVTTGWMGLLEDGILDDYTIVYKWRERGIDLVRFKDLECCPIAYKTAKYNELDRGYFWLSETPDRCSPSYEEGAGPRIVSWVHLEDKKTGAKFYAHSTHFGIGEGRAVIESGKQLARRFSAWPEGTNAFFMGDLNSSYRKYSYNRWAYQPGLKDLRDTAEAMAVDGLCTLGEIRGGTFNHFECPDGSHYIDYIICKPNKSMAVDFFGVLYDQIGVPEKGIAEGYVSDHFAVFAKLRLDTEEENERYYVNEGPFNDL